MNTAPTNPLPLELPDHLTLADINAAADDSLERSLMTFQAVCIASGVFSQALQTIDLEIDRVEAKYKDLKRGGLTMAHAVVATNRARDEIVAIEKRRRDLQENLATLDAGMEPMKKEMRGKSLTPTEIRAAAAAYRLAMQIITDHLDKEEGAKPQPAGND